ncbi:MAG: helix-turn-helix domain-containing protein [Hyphomicrobium sp.]
MRQGVGAGFPQQSGRSDRPGGGVRAPVHAAAPAAASAQSRANIARLFFDLRAALQATPQQAAAQLMTRPETVLALETGHFEAMPHWPEAARIVMAYTALAGIDGRPVLSAMAEVLRESAASQPAPPQAALPAQGHHHFPVDRLRQAGSALAHGAIRLPADALKQVRERPERALYAVSLPLGIVLLLLNTSALQAAFDHVPRPVARMAQDVRQFFQEKFAPVREGMRWIEVDDPRRRRGDKLR